MIVRLLYRSNLLLFVLLQVVTVEDIVSWPSPRTIIATTTTAKTTTATTTAPTSRILSNDNLLLFVQSNSISQRYKKLSTTIHYNRFHQHGQRQYLYRRQYLDTTPPFGRVFQKQDIVCIRRLYCMVNNKFNMYVGTDRLFYRKQMIKKFELSMVTNDNDNNNEVPNSSTGTMSLQSDLLSSITSFPYTIPTPIDSLLDMDIVLYNDGTTTADNTNNITTVKLGAVQEDGSIVQISAWTSEPVFGTMMEFVVDEHDRNPSSFFSTTTVSATASQDSTNTVVVHVFDQSVISYGSRQVSGGKGPGNPHGEESELLYYIDQNAIPTNVLIPIKPELEILW